MPVIAESSLTRDILTPALTAVSEPPHAPAASASPPLPPYPAHLMPLEAALRRRRSVRRFAAEPVSAAELESITRHGLAAERASWPPAVHPAVGLTIAAVAFNVRELGPGLYLADPGTGAFTALPWEKRLAVELPTQYGIAPVMLFVCGSLARACAVYGQRGYPQLLVRAGAVGYGAWLAAIATGLAGCAHGRTSHVVTAAVSQPRGETLRHLFTVAIGEPLDKDAGDH